MVRIRLRNKKPTINTKAGAIEQMFEFNPLE